MAERTDFQLPVQLVSNQTRVDGGNERTRFRSAGYLLATHNLHPDAVACNKEVGRENPTSLKN